MSKIAVATDSNSGITVREAAELGVKVLPMPFMINDELFYEDISLSQDQFYEKLAEGARISTSQPTPYELTEFWNELLKEYDEIVFIPMSSGLSGTCSTATALSMDDEYEGKVHVVNNQRISVTQRQSCLDAMELAERGLSGSEIKDFLEEQKFESSIYIMLDTLEYLKRGGRITPAAAAIGSLFHIKPVLQIQGEKLDAFAKARTTAQGKLTMLNALKNDIQSRFGGTCEDPKIHIAMAYTLNREACEHFKEEAQKMFPNSEIVMAPLSLSVACHIGPGAIAIACSKII